MLPGAMPPAVQLSRAWHAELRGTPGAQPCAAHVWFEGRCHKSETAGMLTAQAVGGEDAAPVLAVGQDLRGEGDNAQRVRGRRQRHQQPRRRRDRR